MVEEAEVVEGCRAIGFTLEIPASSEVGVVDDLLVDRAFMPNRADAAQELARWLDVRPPGARTTSPTHWRRRAWPEPMGWCLRPPFATAFGLPAGRLIGSSRLAVVDGVAYVDDSKATNAHAAQTSLLAYPTVVWIAGGMAKGQTFDELVQAWPIGSGAWCCSGSTGTDRRSPGRHAPRCTRR